MKYFVLAPLLVMLSVSNLVEGAVYHYVDETGRKVYVDRKSQIPEQYRKDIQLRGSEFGKRTSTGLPAVNAKPAPGEGSLEERIAQVEEYIRKLETPVEVRGNSVIVPVQVRYGARDITLKLVLDTGATTTVVYDKSIEILMATTTPSGRARVADGSVVDMHKIAFSRFKVGPYNMEPATASVLEHKGVLAHDGLLGMDFLRQTKYEVDFDRNVIVWSLDNYRDAQSLLERLTEQLDKENEALQKE